MADQNGWTDNQKSAFDIMADTLSQYGLGTLSSVLETLVRGGTTDPSELNLALSQTPEWKQRFAGNEALRKAGLPVLSVQEYLATEQSYSQLMKQYGLPEGFYNDPSDFAGFIGHSVSPSELQSRVQAYADVARQSTDPAVKDQLASMGISDGDILAHLMDPNRALPLLQAKVQQAYIGAAARRSGVVADNGYLEHLVGMGVSQEQAQQGYSVVAEASHTGQRLGEIYGEQFGQHDLEKEVFDGDAAAAQKRKRLASQERSSFSGKAGTNGGIGRNAAGSY